MIEHLFTNHPLNGSTESFQERQGIRPRLDRINKPLNFLVSYAAEQVKKQVLIGETWAGQGLFPAS